MSDFETAAATLYPDQGEEDINDTQGALAGGDHEDQRTEDDRASTLYGENEGEESLASRYYQSLYNDGTVHDFADAFAEEGTDYQEVHEALGRGFHELGVSDGHAKLLMTHLVNADRETPEQAELREREVKDFIRAQDESFLRDMSLAGQYLEQAFPGYGQGWVEELEASATVETLQLLRELVQNKRRGDAM